MAQNYHLILLELLHEVTWSKSFKVGGRQIPFCKYVFLGRTIQMLWGGGDRVGMSRLRWKVRLKVVKTCKKSAQIELEFLKKCYFLTDVHKYSQFS